MKLAIRILLILIVALVLVGFVWQEEPEWTNLEAVLYWLGGVGAPIVVGMAVSFLVENAKWWVGLPTNAKIFIPILFSIGIAVGAQYVITTPIVATVQPIWEMVIRAFLTYLSTQVAYAKATQWEYGTRY